MPIEAVAGSSVVVCEDDPSWLHSVGTHALCAGLGRRGIPVVYLTARRHNLAAIDGAYVVDQRWRATEGRRLFVRLSAQVQNLWVLLWALRRSGANVVVRRVSRPHWFDLVFLVVLHVIHRRVVYDVANVSLSGSGKGLSRLARKVCKRADAIVVPTHASARQIRTAVPDAAQRTHSVPPGAFDAGSAGIGATGTTGAAIEQSEARRGLGLSQRLPILLCVADERDGRAIGDFLAAVDRLRRQGHQVAGILVGSAVEAAPGRYKHKIAAAGLVDHVRLVRAAEFSCYSELFLAACDVVVIPNREVPDPLLAQYARVAARPVVITDVEGFSEVFDSSVSGEMVQPGDPADLAAGIARLVQPRRRLQLAHRELANRPTAVRDWTDVAADFAPVLALRENLLGRRMPIRTARIWIAVLYTFVLFLTLSILNAASAGGFTITNIGLFLGILFPAAVLFVLVVPYDVKFLLFWVALFSYDLGIRAFPKLPMQYIPSLIVGAMVLHLIIESPPGRPKLHGTRLLHAVLIMQVGWAVAEMFNPNMEDVGSSIRMIRLVLEPMLAYACSLAYFRSTHNIRRFVNLYLIVGGLCAFYGLKIAFFGYFGWESAKLVGITAAEGRNVGTMADPMVWGMWMMHIVLVSVALLVEQRAVRYKWWLLAIIPAAGISMVTAGQRIQFLGLAIALLLVVALGLGIQLTRLRSAVAVFCMATLAFVIWYWIPDQAVSRRELESKNPVTAARLKLGSLKNPQPDDDGLTSRLDTGGNTLKAIIDHPLGGGLGLSYVAPIGTGLSQGSSTQVIGETGTQAAQAHNQVPMQIGDFFFINWMAEQGVVGVILIGMIFLLAVLWNLYAAVRARAPLHRALCVAGFAWTVAYIINSQTNGAFFNPTSSSQFLAFLALAVAIPAVEAHESGALD